jgi:hypothetical protein
MGQNVRFVLLFTMAGDTLLEEQLAVEEGKAAKDRE